MPTRSTRLFFAIFPDLTTVNQIASIGHGLHEDIGPGSKATPPEKLHLTLHYLGQYSGDEPTAEIALARQAADAIHHDPVWIRLDAIGSFDKHGAPAPLVLRARPGTRRMRALRSLRQKLGPEVGKVGLPLQSRFEPHVTLGYSGAHMPLRMVDTVEWQASSFALVLSAGGQYRPLAHWRLQG
jgi:2'-5' RNA ligase